MTPAKHLLTLAALLWFAQPSLGQTKATIRGQAIGRNSGKVYLHEAGLLRQASRLVDSTALANGFFSFGRLITEPSEYYIDVDNAPGQFHFVWDKDLVVWLNMDHLNQSSFEESPVNDVLKRFSDTVGVVYGERSRAFQQAILQAREKKDTDKVTELYNQQGKLFHQYQQTLLATVRAQSQSWAGLFLLAAHYKELGRQQARRLLEAMPAALRKSGLGTQLRTALDNTSTLMAP